MPVAREGRVEQNRWAAGAGGGCGQQADAHTLPDSSLGPDAMDPVARRTCEVGDRKDVHGTPDDQVHQGIRKALDQCATNR